MKYILLLSAFFACALSFANEPEQAKVRAYQSVLEYCHANPNHHRCKEIDTILDEVKPRSTISRIWRSISGTGNGLCLIHMRHIFFLSCQEIGKELNWNEEKIREEAKKINAEAERIRTSK